MNLNSTKEETLDALATLQYALIRSNATHVFVNLAPVAKISDAVGVMLYAELQRCIHYRENRYITGDLPQKGTDSYEVLGGLGVHELLGLPPPPLSDLTRSWFQIRDGNCTLGKVIGDLYDHFEGFMSEFVTTGPQWRAKFYRALMDATTNTLNHAYIMKAPVPWLPRRWWAAGLVNKKEKTLRFIFWDQGVGIPKTIRRKGIPGLMERLTPDAALIARAVLEGSSRFRNRRRGHGLFALVELIDMAPAGELHIISRRGWYRHQKGSTPLEKDFGSDLYGTLVVWTLRPEP